MHGEATLMGHPIHPMLIPFPIAFFVGALVCDIISIFGSSPIWPTVSVVLIGFGIVGALIAALFGFIDFVTAPMSPDAKKTATAHLVFHHGVGVENSKVPADRSTSATSMKTP